MYVNVAITVFNKRLSEDRREVYFPTSISGASYLEAKSSGHSTDGAHAESITYKLRIPQSAAVQDVRSYVDETAYDKLTADEAAKCWTIQKGDIVLTCETALTESMDEAAVKQLAASLNKTVITVKEYADNTIRGSAAVKHWRIGGE